MTIFVSQIFRVRLSNIVLVNFIQTSKDRLHKVVNGIDLFILKPVDPLPFLAKEIWH